MRASLTHCSIDLLKSRQHPSITKIVPGHTVVVFGTDSLYIKKELSEFMNQSVSVAETEKGHNPKSESRRSTKTERVVVEAFWAGLLLFLLVVTESLVVDDVFRFLSDPRVSRILVWNHLSVNEHESPVLKPVVLGSRKKENC